MDVYRGVVRNNVVVLERDVHLPEGIAVEVRVPAADAVNEALRARGLLRDAPPAPPEAPAPVDRRPIVVEGRSLSEQIIAERR